jgi:hypothetical protein
MRGGELCESIADGIKKGTIEDFDELKTMIGEEDRNNCEITTESHFNDIKFGVGAVYAEKKDENLQPSQERTKNSSQPQSSGRGVGFIRQNKSSLSTGNPEKI